MYENTAAGGRSSEVRDRLNVVASLGRGIVVVADRGVVLRGFGRTVYGLGVTLTGLVKQFRRQLGLRALGSLLRGLLGLLLFALTL